MEESEPGVAAERDALIAAEDDVQIQDVQIHVSEAAVTGNEVGAEPSLSREDVAQLVSKVVVFQRVVPDRSDFAMALADRCVEMPVEAGPIFARGDAAEEMYLIVAGIVFIHIELHIPAIAELHPGDILGEGALFVRAPRSAFAVAGQNTRLLRLPRTALQEVLPLYPAVEHALAEFAMGRLARANSRLAGASLWTKPVPERPRCAEQLYTLDLAKRAITQQPSASTQAEDGNGQQFSDLAAPEQQRYRDLANDDMGRYRKETAAAGALHVADMLRYRDPAALKALAVCLVAPTAGILPFLLPLEGDLRRCRLGNETSPAVSCATPDPITFIFAILPIWLAICTAFFLELMEIQFKHIGFDEESVEAVTQRGGHPVGFAGSWKQKSFIIIGSQVTMAVCLGLFAPSITDAPLGGDLGTLFTAPDKASVKDVIVYVIVILLSSWPIWWVICRLIFKTSQQHRAHQDKKALAAASIKAGDEVPAVHHHPSIHGILDMLHHHADPPETDSTAKNQNELDGTHRAEGPAIDPILPPLARMKSRREHKRASSCCATKRAHGAVALAGIAAEVFDAKPVGGNHPKINMRRLENDGVSGMQFHHYLTQKRLQQWREESHHGSRAHRGTIRGYALWTLGILLMIANWLWTMVFFALFSAALSSGDEGGDAKTIWGDAKTIFGWGTVFDLSQIVMMQLTVFVLKNCELERIGTNLTTFDRFHLVNIGRFHFVCISAMYKQMLQVNYESWNQFWVQTAQSQVIKVLLFALQAQDWSSRLLGNQPARTDLRGKLAARFNPDPLNQRGSLCFNTYLAITAEVIAAVQFSLFVVVQQLLPYNARVFIDFSTSEPRWDDGGTYDWLQQLAFVCAGVVITYFRYCAIDVTSGRMFGITPTYVGTCHIAQYPRFRRTMVTVSTHVVTDIYVGLLFASIAGVLMVSECSKDPRDTSPSKWIGKETLDWADLSSVASSAGAANRTVLDAMCACHVSKIGCESCGCAP